MFVVWSVEISRGWCVWWMFVTAKCSVCVVCAIFCKKNSGRHSIFVRFQKQVHCQRHCCVGSRLASTIVPVKSSSAHLF